MEKTILLLCLIFIQQKGENMNCAFYTIAGYIVMRGLQVLFAEYAQKLWYKIVIKSMTVVMLYAALASLVVWYEKIQFLGFDPTK